MFTDYKNILFVSWSLNYNNMTKMTIHPPDVSALPSITTSPFLQVLFFQAPRWWFGKTASFDQWHRIKMAGIWLRWRRNTRVPSASVWATGRPTQQSWNSQQWICRVYYTWTNQSKQCSSLHNRRLTGAWAWRARARAVHNTSLIFARARALALRCRCRASRSRTAQVRAVQWWLLHANP